MKTETGYIYRYTHRESGKSYIGQTWDLKTRRQRHESLSQEQCRHFCSALKKHGVDEFGFDILCTTTDQATLDALEMCYIKVLNTLSPNGYNLTTGGNGGKASDEACQNMSKNNARYWQGKQRSAETRRKLSEANKGKRRTHSKETRMKIAAAARGRRHTSETKQKLSDCRKGKPSSRKGKRHSAETRRKMSENNAMRRPEVRKKKSEASKGNTPWNKGKPLAEETKRKLSEANKGKQLSAEHRHKISKTLKGKRRVKKSSSLQIKLF